MRTDIAILHNSKTCAHSNTLQVSQIYKLTWRQDALYYFQGNILPFVVIMVFPFILSPRLLLQVSVLALKENGSLRTCWLLLLAETQMGAYSHRCLEDKVWTTRVENVGRVRETNTLGEARAT